MWRTSLIVLLAGSCAAPIAAQTSVPGERTDGRAAVATSDIQRIKAGLRAAATLPGPGLRLDLYVDVRGDLDPFDRFEHIDRFALPDPLDFERGAVPHAAPTHTDLVNEMTPRNFRVRGGDPAAGVRWLVDWLRGRR